ncbi:calcium-binding and coiled-coil domain-containing protein 1 isoform X2 [Anabrus simplex]|uniref:calcium-binding and coiled-coil domain-containing protein 1 isoform X2 n=1 Tax=Anabrus simplex TaxID=316456 RepID=UPI0035A37DA5
MTELQQDEASSLNDDISGIIGEYSIPHIGDMNSESLLTQSQYAKVIFHDIADTYPTDSDVCCQYSLTVGVTPAHGDRIALYRVGWSSVQEYLLFEWAPEPQTEKQTEFQVLFKASALPKDVNEFYQLCYLTSECVVQGASVPFQFRHPQDDDLCVVEGPGDMAVVRSRSALAEEKLRQAVKRSIELRREKEEVEKKLQDLTENFGIVSKELQGALQQVSQLETAKQSLEKELSEMAHLDRLLANLKRDYEVLDKEKNETTAKLHQLEHHVEVLSATITALTTDKEHLANLLRAEISKHVDAKQYRHQTDGLQAMLEALTQSKELVAQELRSEQVISAKLRQDLDQAKNQIEGLQKQIAELGLEKQTLEDLLEQTLSTQPSKSAPAPDGENAIKIAQLQQEKENLLAELTRIAGAERDLANMCGVVQKRTEECGALQQQLKNTKLTLHERDITLSERIEEVKLLQKKLSEKESILLEMESKLVSAEARSKIDQTKVDEERKILAKRINELEIEKADLEKTLQETKSRSESVNSLEVHLAKLEIEKKTTEAQLKEAASCVMLLGERIVTVKCRLNELESERAVLENELTQVMQTCRERREERDILREHQKAQEQRLRESLGISAASESGYFTHELRCTKQELQDVEFFLESSEMRSAELNVRLEEMNQERSALQQQLEQSESLREKHGEDVRALERRLLELTKKALELTEVQMTHSMESKTTVPSAEQNINADMLQDLKKRLQLAATEYQKLYHEKQKAERRLAKVLNRKTAPSPSNCEPSSEPTVVQDLLSLSQTSDTSGNEQVHSSGATCPEHQYLERLY